MVNKLLYITYISMNLPPSTGSSVRPQKMRQAFEALGIEVKTFDGENNDLAVRKKTVSDIRKLLNTWKPDACYIEPPSGPLFYAGDVALIKQLHRMGVAVAIFYRDAYWKHPEYYVEGRASLTQKAKRAIIKMMQMHQWAVFKKNMDIIYFPSETMAKEFDCSNSGVLPPGGFIPDVERKRNISEPLQYIFVGGAAKNHGTFLTLDAFERVNEKEVKAKLIYVCPESQWKSLSIDEKKYKKWLTLVHASGDDMLNKYYSMADIAILTAPRTVYRDFAVPIKLYEYMSYLKPMLVTDCIETARVVKENMAGWIVKDDVESIAEQINYLCEHPEIIKEVNERLVFARERNLWINRAQKVIDDFNR